MFFDAMTPQSGDTGPTPGDDVQMIRHLQQEQERLHQRLLLIETRLGIIYRPKIRLPDTEVEE
jgi:hypothetical protein